MSVSEQAKELREKASYINGLGTTFQSVISLLREAADTIERLDKNLKYTCCDGEWVYCWDGKELPEESGIYNVIVNNPKVFEKYRFDSESKIWLDKNGNRRYVIAWWRKYEFEI